MKKQPALFPTLVITLFILLISTSSHAYDEPNAPQRTYGEIIKTKAAVSFTNFATAGLEVPKNIIKTTNESNLLFGVTGGLLKGFLHMFGRMGASFTDIMTLPLPTKPILEPAYIWDDFNADTTYHPIFEIETPVN